MTDSGTPRYEVARIALSQARAFVPKNADERQAKATNIAQIEAWMRRNRYEVPKR